MMSNAAIMAKDERGPITATPARSSRAYFRRHSSRSTSRDDRWDEANAGGLNDLYSDEYYPTWETSWTIWRDDMVAFKAQFRDAYSRGMTGV